MPRTIHFSFVGGSNHFWHLAPVAAALASDPDLLVRAFVNNGTDAHALREMLAELEATTASIEIIEMKLPTALRWIGKLSPKWRDLKAVRLLYWNRKLRNAAALVAAERTSTLLRKLPGRVPFMIHIPHGAGDRAQGFERRIAMFDYVIVAGEKDKRRMISLGLVDAANCSVSGYIKLSALNRLYKRRQGKLFANDRPVICYNAHFNGKLSSWHNFAQQIIEHLIQDGRYNLIVAPHIRLSERLSDIEKLRWEALAISDRIIVDLGSDRSMDMSYTLAADIYLGDVSSQVYEFVAEPRPCVFINGHQADWPRDPNYRMWHFGDVIDDLDQLIPALDAAVSRHRLYREIQRSAVTEALGDIDKDAAAIAADLIKNISR